MREKTAYVITKFIPFVIGTALTAWLLWWFGEPDWYVRLVLWWSSFGFLMGVTATLRDPFEPSSPSTESSS